MYCFTLFTVNDLLPITYRRRKGGKQGRRVAKEKKNSKDFITWINKNNMVIKLEKPNL